MMKTNNRIFFRLPVMPLWLIFGISLMLSSCKKTDDEFMNFEYLLDYEQVSALSQISIQILLTALSQQYPEAGALLANTSYSVEVYRITYSTYYKDSLIEASGLVCVPVAEEEFPVISFQNATTTLHENAPSVNPYYTDYLLIEGMAGNGYIIFMPDYIGFGASEEILHPYYNRVCTNTAVIDMIKAGNELLNTSEILAANSSNYYLMGYSQGGGATLSVLDEIENGTDPGFDVIAASCGAGAFDLLSMSEHIMGQITIPSALYLPYFIYAQQVYGSLQDDLDKYFNEPYASRIPQLFDGTKSSEEINAQLTDTVQDLLTPDFITDFSDGPEFSHMRTLMQSNSMEAWNTMTLIHFTHGSDDIHVPPSQSSETVDDFIGIGVSADQVKYFEKDGLTHQSCIIPWGIETILWFNELEGK